MNQPTTPTSRATITILAGAAAAGIVGAVMVAVLATSSAGHTPPPATAPVEQAYTTPEPQSPEMTEFVFWAAWDEMDDGAQFALCLEVWDHGTRDAAAILNDASDEYDYHEPTLIQALGDACN